MNPRAVAVWAVAGVMVALVTGNPVYRVLVLLIAANVLLRRRLPGRRLGALFTATAVAALTAVVLNLLLAHTGEHEILSLPASWPGIGGPVTMESGVFGVVTALGLAAAFLCVAGLSYLVEPDAAVDALPGFLERTGTVIAAALALVPALGRSFRSVREAQVARGWRPRGPRSWSDVLVPVVLTTLEDSIQLAEAMETRAFGSGSRTRLAPPRWTAGDGLVAVSAAVAAIAFIVARATGLTGEWYPYPTLSAPPISTPLLVACLLLAVPLLPWPSPDSSA